MFDAYLFDLDGTLIDSIPSIVRSQRYALQTTLSCDLPDPVLKSGIGTPLKLQMRQHAAKIQNCAEHEVDDALVETLCSVYLKHNLQSHLSGEIAPFEGIRALFDWLREGVLKGATQVGLVTSKARATVEIDLQKTGLKDVFATLVCGEDVTKAKPSPDPVIEAVRRLDVNASRCIYVGDALCDLYAGRAAGVKTGAACWGPFGLQVLIAAEPDFYLETPLDLQSL